MKLYLTKHKGGQSRDITSLAVSWAWCGDKASVTPEPELGGAFVVGSDLTVAAFGVLGPKKG